MNLYFKLKKGGIIIKYVMSDIHGCYNEYIKMLELINFNSNDELYILGDIFDRGNKPLEILDHIVNNKNIYLLKGNHEKMFEDAYEYSTNIQLWYYNGGYQTDEAIVNSDTFTREATYKYVKNLPFIKIVDNFILVHAGLYLPNNYNKLTIDEIIKLQKEDYCLWDRSFIGNEIKLKDYTIIVGHTPVQTITKDCKNNPKILHRNGTIYIDCGCAFKKVNGRLGCLRLDDMKEFYI